MSSTRDVSHPEMLPCVVSAMTGLATHSSTAARSAARSPKAPAGSSLAAAGTTTTRNRHTLPMPWSITVTCSVVCWLWD